MIIDRTLRLSSLCAGLGTILALSGCPGSSTTPGNDTGTTPRDGGIDSAVPAPDMGVDAFVPIDAATLVDSGTDTGTTANDDAGTDAAAAVDANLAPDMGLSSVWDNCGEAVVFASEGEPCSFTGSCIECVLTPAPRQALCMSGRLRVTAAGTGACATTPDTGMVAFPDSGPRIDAGMGADGGQCNPFQIATPTTAACPMSVVDCIRTGGSISSCVTADATCLGCVQVDIQACATQTGGCDDEAGRARCCFEANCPDGSCSTTTCMPQWNAYVSCVQATTCTPSDVCFPVPPACPALSWPAPTMVSCTAATATCVDGAADGTAVQACIDADTTTPAGTCNRCFQDGIISCVTDTGACTSELGNTQCCIDTACPTGDSACVETALAAGGTCATIWDGFFTCVNDTIGTLAAGACATNVGTCFP